MNVASTLSDILKLRSDEAFGLYTEPRGVRDKIETWLADPANGFFGQPLRLHVSMIYTGTLELWPFVFKNIQKDYSVETGWNVSMSEDGMNIIFAAAQSTPPA